MKTIHLALALGLFATSCRTERPPADLVETTTETTAPSTKTLPTLELAGRDPVSGAMRLRMTNTTERTYTFVGYGPDAPILTEEFFADGAWSPGPFFAWCGTGLEARTFAPGSSLTFSSYSPAAERPGRVTIRLTDTTTDREVELTSATIPVEVR